MVAVVRPCGSNGGTLLKSAEGDFEILEESTLQEKELVENQEILFLVYPNPSKGNFNILPNDNAVKYTMALYNLQGKLVFSESNRIGEQNIDISNLSKGYYMLKIITEKKVITEKLLIE
jgi:hypothetical protein